MLLPVCRPVLAALLLQVFTGQWNAYLWPLMATNTDVIIYGLLPWTVQDISPMTASVAETAYTASQLTRYRDYVQTDGTYLAKKK